MCGIAGILLKKTIDKKRIDEFIEASKLMNHRGPDHMAVRYENNCVLIHFRLSIIDLDERSNQPFYSKSGDFVTVYNGELYNYKEIAKQYQIEVRTSSDTEVLLESFEIAGLSVVDEWNGIFSCAIYDRKKRELHLIRDRFGVKPLYIYEDNEVLAFASEAKVLYQWMQNLNLNKVALSQFIWFHNSTGDETIVHGVKKHEPGFHSCYSFDGELIFRRQFWDIPLGNEYQLSEDNAILELKMLLEKAVERQLVSDVPKGILLSGGVDSSILVALASKSSNFPLDTFSIDYDYNIGGKSELANARLIAKRFNTNHNELRVTSDNVVEDFSKLVFQYDEPFSDPGFIPLYQLAKACGKSKKVILQGDGGDEFFAGYRRYNMMNSFLFWKLASKLYSFIPSRSIRERMKRINFILEQKEESNLFSYFLSEEVPYKDPYQVFTSDMRIGLNDVNWRTSYEKELPRLKGVDVVQKLLYLDTKILLPNQYLEKVDKCTMLCSIESRVPFLDNNLTEFALRLPSKMKVKRGVKKYILKKAMRGIIPDEILDGKKRGFDVPVNEWMRNDLYGFAYDTFKEHKLGVLDTNSLLKLLEAHKSKKVNYGPLLWKSLVLAHWLDLYKSKISVNGI